MSKQEAHVAIVPITEDIILRTLSLEGGRILRIAGDEYGVWDFVIEHPAFPVAHEGASLVRVKIIQEMTTCEHGGVLSVKRTHPITAEEAKELREARNG